MLIVSNTFSGLYHYLLKCFFSVLLCFNILHLSAETPLLNLTMQNVSLHEILKKIKELSGKNILYNNNLIDKFTNETIELKNATLEDALRKILEGKELKFSIIDDVIIIEPDAEKQNPDKSNNFIQKVKGNFTISGIIKDGFSGETLPYVSIYIEGTGLGVQSNPYGFYSITLPAGTYHLEYKCVGYKDNTKIIVLDNDIRSEEILQIKNREMDEVVITQKNNDLSKIETRMTNIDVTSVKELPALGEPDILRNIQLLPGVTSPTELGGGFNVRGGGADQNLMLLDEAIVYNPYHLIGLYSVFNTNIIKDVKFYTSGIPASYGGRLSSVMDITQKDGNMNSFHGSAGIGLISSDISLEGPIAKDKSSFIIALRRSYIDLFFPFFTELKNTKTYFYDLNSKLNIIINNNNRIYFSFYSGNDITNVLSENEEYGNITSTLRYNHIFNRKLFSNTSLIFSKYKMTDNESANPYSYNANLGLNNYEFKNSFMYFIPKHKIEFGINIIDYLFHPGELSPMNDSSDMKKIVIPDQYSIESAVYLSDNFHINSKIEMQYGLRASDFCYLGPQVVNEYSNGALPNIIGTISYKRNQVIKSYNNLEPRLSIKYSINDNNSLKLSYNKLSQYIQQISDTEVPLPFDMWKPSNNYIKPLIGNQFSIGYFSDLYKNTIEFSIEAYYKLLQNVIQVRPGANITLDTTLDADLLQGKGRAFGCELMVNKTKGKLTGMISYAFSRSLQKVVNPYLQETINNGNWYPSLYDIPDKISVAGEYKLTSRISFTIDFSYMTGEPITLPSGQYTYFGYLIPYYSNVNLQRYPDYNRLDIGMVLHSKKKPNRKWEGFWNFSIYNVYGRENAYSIYIQRIYWGTQNTQANEIWLMTVFPSASCTIKF